jgi:hypothetical protein
MFLLPERRGKRMDDEMPDWLARFLLRNEFPKDAEARQKLGPIFQAGPQVWRSMWREHEATLRRYAADPQIQPAFGGPQSSMDFTMARRRGRPLPGKKFFAEKFC